MKYEKIDYAGIDYGHGKSNIDNTNGIRFSTISVSEVSQAWYDSSKPYYGKTYFCPECRNEIQEISEGEDIDNFEVSEGTDVVCYDCKKLFDSYECLPEEPISWYIDENGLQAEQSQDTSDIIITRSPYFTYGQFCSPCFPGGIHLENPISEKLENNRGYCFGHDFFEGNIAPYPVYSVATGKKVKPE